MSMWATSSSSRASSSRSPSSYRRRRWLQGIISIRATDDGVVVASATSRPYGREDTRALQRAALALVERLLRRRPWSVPVADPSPDAAGSTRKGWRQASLEGSGSAGSIRQTEKYDQGAIEPHQVLCKQPAKVLMKVSSGHCRHLVHHEPAQLVQAIQGRRLNGDPRQRCLDRVRRQRTHRHRRRCTEAVVLHDHHRTRLARVRTPNRGGIDLAASQPGCGSSSVLHPDEIASTNA